MNFNNNNKHEIKTKFRFIDNEMQGNTGVCMRGSRSKAGVGVGLECGEKGSRKGEFLDCVCAVLWLCK